MKEKNSQKGFTIVEVSLVLAIAGLIFLMVFIALPALQRSQRDAKRRDDVGELLTAIQKYQNNNRGALPENSAAPAEFKKYLRSSFEDPLGHEYMLTMQDCGVTGTGKCEINGTIQSANFPNGHKMYIVRSAACEGSEVIGSGNPRKVAVLYKMEGGGGTYCASMQ